MNPLLNILIRTHGRPKSFERCINSILKPDNLDIRIIICYDDDLIGYPDWFSWFIETGDTCKVKYNSQPFGYNTYCNNLLKMVTDSHSIFLDDDDEIIPGSLERLATKLIDTRSLIVPFMRGEFQKPTSLMMYVHAVRLGYIGLPSLIVHKDHIKHLNFQADEYTDYNNISYLAHNEPLIWFNCPIVKSDQRNYGKKE